MISTHMTGLAGALGALAVAALVATPAAQGGMAAADGVYTEAQAARGEQAYTRACASCHMPDLRGESFAPALAEDAFAGRWNGKSVGDLYIILQGTMPMDAPASMKPEEYADLVAFLLKKNGYPASMTELKSDAAALKLIKFKS